MVDGLANMFFLYCSRFLSMLHAISWVMVLEWMKPSLP